jgi:hypothetical protein
MNSVLIFDVFGFGDECLSTAIRKRGMQSCEINARRACVPVDHCRILYIFTKNKVRLKELPM